MYIAALDMKKGDVYRGEPRENKAQCTITVNDEDMMALAQGKLNAQQVTEIINLITANDFETSSIVPLF